MRKISMLLVAAFVATFSLVMPKAAQGAAFFPSDLTSQGQKAVQQIGDCVNSKRSLQVYYLIDGSGSLAQTDPKNLRAEVLATSLEQLAPKQGSDIQVSYAVGTFGTRFRALKSNWTKLTPDNAAAEANWFRKTIPGLTHEGNTNWEDGLQGAIDALASAKAKDPTACQVAVWLTDGGIDLGGSSSDFSQEANALENLCGTNPTSGTRHDDAVINQLRNSKVNVIGVLLRNEEVMQKLYQNSRPQYNALNSTMSFMLPIVEGSGGVDGMAFDYSGENFSCGATGNSFAAGAELVASNSLQLGLQFARVVARSNNGAPTNVYGDRPAHFVIDQGIAYFEALISSSSWQLKNPKGDLISSPSSGIKPSLSAGAYLVRVPIKSQADLGEWSIENTTHNQADVFLYSGLQMKVDVRNIQAGKPVGISGQIVDKNGKPANLNVYGSSDIRLRTFNAASGVDAEIPLQLDAATGTFSGSFTPPAQMSKATFDVSLGLTTKSGVRLSPLTLQKEARVALPAEYPHIQGTGLEMSLLSGTKGISKGTLILEGSKLNDGVVCLSVPSIRIDPKPSRIASFTWSKYGKGCISIAQGTTVKVDYEVGNKIQSTGMSSGAIPAVFKSSATGFAPISQEISVKFQSKLKKNLLIFYLVLFGLMLLGLLIPTAILYFFGYRNSRILWGDGIQRVEVPVWITSDGIMTRRDGKPSDGGGMGASKGEYEWSGQSSERLRSFTENSSVGVIQVRGRASRNPFGDPVVVANAAQGSRIITSLGGFAHQGQVGHIGVDMGQAWFIVASDYALTHPSEADRYEASVVSYLRHDASKGNAQATDRNIEMQSNTALMNFKEAIAGAQAPVIHPDFGTKKNFNPFSKKTKAVEEVQVPEGTDPFSQPVSGYTTQQAQNTNSANPFTPTNQPSSSGEGSSSPFGGSY